MNLSQKIFKHKIFLVSLFVFAAVFFASSHVLAVAGDTFGINRVGSVLPLGGEDIRIIIAKIIRIFLSLLGIIAVGLMLYAGFTWMTSAGNEEKIGTAKKIMINATIGLVIIMSSFALTQFILNSLADATGSGNADDAGGGRAPILCANFADCQNLVAPECGDGADEFVVKSLTPRTPSNNATGMSNTIIRAVFSKPLDAGQDLNQIFKLTLGGNPVALRSINILEGRFIVEALLGQDTALCESDGITKSCLSPGDYHIEVNPELTAAGIKLKTKLACGDFDNTSNFTVNRDFLDLQKPFVDSITFNGRNANDQQNLARGAKYRLNATFEDRRREDGQNISFGGIAYLSLNVKSDPQDLNAAKTDWSYYTGPLRSSNDPFSLSRELVFGDQFPVPAQYTFTFNVGDIDHNNFVVTSTFVLDGQLCHNGKQDPGETGVDVGGECLGDGQCRADWQCISGDCDEATGRCINRPIIQNVDVGGVNPDSWDGAPGSWATIVGNFFGSDPGHVYFGVDNNNNGTIDEGNGEWVEAPLANCSGFDVWSSRQVIVEIPNIAVGTSTTIRIKTRAVGDIPEYDDLSTDNRGPKSGPNAGIFKISNNDHPGLCAVLNSVTNTNVASTTAPIVAFGRALGNGANSSLLFGGVAAPPAQRWEADTILSSVPQNMKPGRVGVRAKIGDAYTNGVEFVIVDSDADLNPHIDAISPNPTSTLESLMTISGSHFGSPGVVYFASTKDAALACATTNDNAIEAACTRLDLINLPRACENTWSDTQIIGKIPAGIPLGEYFIVVKNDSGHSSDGTATLQLVAGAPLPGLCKLSPDKGVSPLADGQAPLSLTGINLSPAPELYFWSINHWLQSSVDLDPQGGHNIIRAVAANGTGITTILPVGANGVSMSTGPIRARVGNEFSNAIQYTVTDCTLGGDAPGANYQCCAQGPEKGMWKPQGLACSGETRSAGYIWRFTTGLIPKVPYVIEACNIEQWNDANVQNFVRPSPSPWQNWRVGDACIDSVITLQFSMHMSEFNLNNAIRVYTCGQGDTPDCVYDADHDVTSHYTPVLLPGGQENILEIRLSGGETHAAETWHRVILGNTLHANEHGPNDTVNTAPLSLQRPLKTVVNGITVAYNFDFKTGNARCSLFGAAITPPSYTTHLLGVIQNPGFDISSNFDNPPHPFYYYVWGRGTQACSVVDVNGKGWEWKPRRLGGDLGSNFAYTTKSDTVNIPPASSTYYKDVRATATALQNTLLDPVVITATTNTMVDGVPKDITGSSNLYIQLGDPKVVQKWPDCNQSCTNINIGVRFNFPMVTSTYNLNGVQAIKVQKCVGLGENCLDLAPANGIALRDLNDGAFDPYQYEVTPVAPLELNTLYQVVVSNQIHSFAGILNNQTIEGRALVPEIWKFRTKLKDGICILDKVDVVPNPFVASLVDQKTAYGASPLSSPDQCSPRGQRLNPWAYGWNWAVEHPDVAEITDFSTKGTPPAFCSGRCLPAGSDIPFGTSAYLCGNGSVDPGEDCDIAANINDNPATPEQPGVSCMLNCLRPGNANVTSTINPANIGLCGNGLVEESFGEECDPGIDALKPYCSNTCNWKGSSQEFSADAGTLQCGNGRVGLAGANTLLGEECDLGISLDMAGPLHPSWAAIGCSQNCLHQGTALSRVYCEAPASRLNDEQRQSDACRASVTICGDGNLDPGEECERSSNDNNSITVYKPGAGIASIGVDSATSTCSNRCILQNICDIKDNISSDFTCDAGTVGCKNDCTKAGSSPLYEQASLCGDGISGVGENPQCEPANLLANPGLDQDPIQVVTALGNGLVNPLTLMQESKIFARATQVRKSVTSTVALAANFSGAGDYSLQCGYVEYPQPIMQDNVLRSNNCPDPSQGVAASSCCQLRPTRTSEYPRQGAGISDDSQICRNTYIEANFDRVLDQNSVNTNILIASLHPRGYNCASSTETDITDEINSLLIAFNNDEVIPENFFARVWFALKQFFVNIFNSVVHAAVRPPIEFASISREVVGKVWCTGKIVPKVTVIPQFAADGTPNGSSAAIYINDLLEENTDYAVLFHGGNFGVKDLSGVGIRGKSLRNSGNQLLKDDIFFFKTSDQICKIQSITVDPSNQLFNTPAQVHHFTAEVHSNNGGRIVSTPGYSWEWGWQPEINDLFTVIPPTNTLAVDISSKNIQGTLVMAAQATITADMSQVGAETGKVYSGLTNLTSLFCENPWPSLATYPYEDGVSSQMQFDGFHVTNNDNFNLATHAFDGTPISPVSNGGTYTYFNFSFGYCADAGKSATTTDDLPMLAPVVSGKLVLAGACHISGLACFTDADCPSIDGVGQGCEGDHVDNNNNFPTTTFKKFLFFNEQNNDVIGVQIFPNSERKSARQWFIDQKFSGIEQYQNISINGYDAISDGNNTYVNALNQVGQNFYNYIYLFAINADAQDSTRQIFSQILSNLKFNINIPERKQCVSGNGVSGGQYLPNDLNNLAVTSLPCDSDYDCRNLLGTPLSTSNGLCADAQTKLQRDWTRLFVIKDTQAAIENTKTQTGGYPNLPAGTYIPGYTNTHWPSWGAQLLKAIGPISPAPLNEWSACGYCAIPVQVVANQPRYVACSSSEQCAATDQHPDLGICNVPDDQETCWNSQLATFACPAISNVFEYYATDTKNYKLYLPLEYFKEGDAFFAADRILGEYVSTTHFSASPFCAASFAGVSIMSPAAGSCGNGIVEPASEECDPVGASVHLVVNNCPAGQTAFKTCNNTCHYDAPVCRPAATCGNGRIDHGVIPREDCDEGNLNGTYGHCGLNCTLPPTNYCGDTRLDAGFEVCDKGAQQFARLGYCSNSFEDCEVDFDCGANAVCLAVDDPSYHITNSNLKSCASDCSGVGGYCGDGKLQAQYEMCDDGNTTSLDGCSQHCQTENFACVNASRPEDFEVQINSNPHLTTLTMHFGQNAPDACRQSTGDDICRGMGLTCESSRYAVDGGRTTPFQIDRGVVVPPGEVAQCMVVFPSDINVDVEVRCVGDRVNAPAAVDAPVLGSCGNNHIDEGEVCDTGLAQNGQICTPEYGRSCTYCAADCKKVLTRDPIASCGNGKIDAINTNTTSPAAVQVEVCDTDPVSNEVKIFDSSFHLAASYPTFDALNKAYNDHSISKVCTATAPRYPVGTVRCTNNCQVLDTGDCKECGGFTNEGKAIPKLAVLNVLSPSAFNSVWGSQTAKKMYVWNNADTVNKNYAFTCGNDSGWSNRPPLVYYFSNSNNCLGTNTKLDIACIPSHRKYETGVNMQNYMTEQWLCRDAQNFPLDVGYGYKKVNTRAANFVANNEATWSWGQYAESLRGVETSLQCSDRYAVYFNEKELRAPADANGNRPARTPQDMKNYGSFFPYPVNNEAHVVQDEMILSPAVPKDTFRVVVKWKYLAGIDVSFSPVVYNTDFVSIQNANAEQRFNTTVSYPNALAYNHAHPGEPTHICTLMEPLYSQRAYTDAQKAELNRIGILNYWKPDQCSSFNSNIVMGDPNFLSSGDIYVHGEGQLNTLSEQALTIYTGNVFGTHRNPQYNSPYAIFVQSFTPDGDIPITSFNNLDVTVDVYEYHPNQSPEYSLYMPTQTFSLKAASMSTNIGIGFVKYWHVFNLIKNAETNKYEIQPVYNSLQNTTYQNGVTVTDFADLLCNVPGEQCRRD